MAFLLFKDEYLGRIKALRKEEEQINQLTKIPPKNLLLLMNAVQGLSPHAFFSQESRGLLRCIWAFAEYEDGDEEWIDLPGPPEIWPDNQEYYITHGFEVRPDRATHHRRALELLALTKAPKGWMDEVVHENDPYELIWQRGYQPMS
jgi:hypothetical protein